MTSRETARATVAALLILSSAATAAAQNAAETTPYADDLTGAVVSLQAIVQNEGEAPLFVGVVHRAVVGPEIEYTLGDEPIQNGIYIVTSHVDIEGARLSGGRYPTSGRFLDTDFNGFKITLEDGCGFAEARIVEEETTMALEPEDVYVRDGAAHINVSNLPYGPELYYVIELTLAACSVS